MDRLNLGIGYEFKYFVGQSVEEVAATKVALQALKKFSESYQDPELPGRTYGEVLWRGFLSRPHAPVQPDSSSKFQEISFGRRVRNDVGTIIQKSGNIIIVEMYPYTKMVEDLQLKEAGIEVERCVGPKEDQPCYKITQPFGRGSLQQRPSRRRRGRDSRRRPPIGDPSGERPRISFYAPKYKKISVTMEFDSTGKLQSVTIVS